MKIQEFNNGLDIPFEHVKSERISTPVTRHIIRFLGHELRKIEDTGFPNTISWLIDDKLVTDKELETALEEKWQREKSAKVIVIHDNRIF